MFFQAEDGIRDLVRSRGLGDVYKRQGMLMVVKRTLRSANSAAAHQENASSAAFDATYAEKRGGLASTPIEEILMM